MIFCSAIFISFESLGKSLQALDFLIIEGKDGTLKIRFLIDISWSPSLSKKPN